jgi:Asp-tRNA(Asn)/Glu-tRNA(Gln) amidotransferase A subunit family amidase
MTTSASGPVFGPAVPPPGLLEAFWRYDAALLANDVSTLDSLFAPGPHTLRGDGRNLLVGWDAITAFRSARARTPTRTVVEVNVRMITDDAALLVARTRDDGAYGLQTQLWQRLGGRWYVTAAHITPAVTPAGANTAPGAGSGAFDTRIWRVVGEPLLPATAAGPLDGQSVAVKDLFSVAGQPVGAGNPTYLAGQVPQTATAPAVATLLAAGAYVRGITRTDEFAYGLAGTNAYYGTPPNPAAPGRVSGGSSSGSASAVALGQASIGLGTDTAGSIRVPASYQGLVGLRTTHGAIGTTGVLPLAPSFDTVGWITRDIATSRAVAEAFFAPPADPLRPQRALVIPAFLGQADPAIRASFDDTLARLTGGGLLPPVVTQPLSRDELETWFHAFRTVQAWEAWRAHGPWLTGHPGSTGADVAARFRSAAAVTGEQAAAARDVVNSARHRLRSLLQDAMIVLPTTSDAAPAIGSAPGQIEAARAATLRLTCLAGLAASPAVSLPLLRSATGLPVGLSLIAPRDTDVALARLAQQLMP